MKEFEFAPQFNIEQYEHIARYFFLKIFNMEYEDILLTDESSINDFLDFTNSKEQDKKELQDIFDKIQKEYKIDISDVPDLLFVEIFKRIEHLT